MRTWTYSYNTSDGLRHEGEIEADSKDDAYAALRGRGIRPIRVTERITPVVKRGFGGLRRRDWMALAAVAGVLVAVISVVAMKVSSDASAPVPDKAQPLRDSSSCLEYRQLISAVQAESDAHRKAMDEVDRELLSNYALVFRSRDLSEFRAEIERGRKVCEASRAKIRDIYRDRYGGIPESNHDEQVDAQRVYGVLMDALDADEERLSSDECALELLDSNRGKWKVRRGAVVWDDPRLDAEFRLYCRENIPGTMRWQRDFRGAVVPPVITAPRGR